MLVSLHPPVSSLNPDRLDDVEIWSQWGPQHLERVRYSCCMFSGLRTQLILITLHVQESRIPNLWGTSTCFTVFQTNFVYRSVSDMWLLSCKSSMKTTSGLINPDRTCTQFPCCWWFWVDGRERAWFVLLPASLRSSVLALFFVSTWV